jgi:hypothetical protein
MLKLKCTPYLSAYKVSWMHKGHQVIISQQCLLNFQMGNYEDQVLCDVVAMGSCQVLFGKHWLYDEIVSHVGTNNTYHFEKEEENLDYIWESMPNNEDGSNNNIMLCSNKEFLEGLKSSKCCLLIFKKMI